MGSWSWELTEFEGAKDSNLRSGPEGQRLVTANSAAKVFHILFEQVSEFGYNWLDLKNFEWKNTDKIFVCFFNCFSETLYSAIPNSPTQNHFGLLH